MTNEELLIPRVVVVGKIPLATCNVGDVLRASPLSGVSVRFYADYPINKEWSEMLDPAEYPHLFKPLQWWECRDVKDLPEYVKGTDLIFKKDIKIVNVDWVKIKGYLSIKNKLLPGWHRAEHYDLIPVTESEYLEYLKSKQ